MQAPVDPVDEEIGEGDEEWELHPVVQGEGRVGWSIVETGIAAHLTQKERRGKYGHDGERTQCLADLQGNLVFEVFGVGESGMVKDEDVG